MTYRAVTYPGRPPMAFGYNAGAGTYDAAHLALAKASGATVFRMQMSWPGVEDYTTGALSLSAGWSQFFTDCATYGIKPMVVAAYGPPQVTLGSVVLTNDVPLGTPAGTPIAVNSYGFTIDWPFCFVGTVGTVTARGSYYGSLITAATPTSITLAAATSVALTAGTSLPVQRLRYSPPITDTDPSHAAFVRYATFLAEQMAAAGCEGYVNIWNEWVWAHDTWSDLALFYDSPPANVTATSHMFKILELANAQPLPPGVSFVNGVSDKSSGGGMVAQGFTTPGSVTHDSLHPYANNPEGQSWQYYSWGYDNGYAPPARYPNSYGSYGQWLGYIDKLEQGANFRSLALLDSTNAGGAYGLIAGECGFATADDTAHARYLLRRVLSLWGCDVTPVIYAFDTNEAPGSTTYSVAPQSTPRPSYYALQRLTQIIGRMSASAPGTAAPSLVGWPSDVWPLMSHTVLGDPGHAVLLVWQRTRVNSTDARVLPWAGIASPSVKNAQFFVPSGMAVAEATDLIADTPVTVTVAGNLLTIPITDNVTAVRFAPA